MTCDAAWLNEWSPVVFKPVTLCLNRWPSVPQRFEFVYGQAHTWERLDRSINYLEYTLIFVKNCLLVFPFSYILCQILHTVQKSKVNSTDSRLVEYKKILA